MLVAARSISSAGSMRCRRGRIRAERGPASLAGDVHDMSGERIEDGRREQQQVDLIGGGRIDFAEHHGGVGE